MVRIGSRFCRGGMELDETLLARLETMIEAMGQAVEWWDEVEDDGEGASEDVGGVELDKGSERPSEEVPDNPCPYNRRLDTTGSEANRSRSV